MKRGDLVQFIWPKKQVTVAGVVTLWENARVGIVLNIFHRMSDSNGDEITVYHDNVKWSVPEVWCKVINETG
jgi:hypothetical protein